MNNTTLYYRHLPSRRNTTVLGPELIPNSAETHRHYLSDSNFLTPALIINIYWFYCFYISYVIRVVHAQFVNVYETNIRFYYSLYNNNNNNNTAAIVVSMT